MGKRKKDFDELFINFLFVEIFLLVYLRVGQSIIEPFITLVAGVRVLQMIKKSKSLQRIVMLSMTAITYLLFVTVIQMVFSNLIVNLQYLLRPLILTLYLTEVMLQKPDIVRQTILNKVEFFNVYYAINLVLMIIQWKRDVFYDNITGFIGIYGTHRLSIFVCFLVLLNLKVLNKAKHKVPRVIYIVFIVATTLWISSVNDNTAVYILLPMTILLYIFSNSEISLKSTFKVLGVVVVAVISLNLLMKNDEINYFLEQRLFYKVEGMSQFLESGEADEERFVYIVYAMENLQGDSIGMGIGKYKLVGDEVLSGINSLMRNWGMSNLASLISAGGVVFAFLFIGLYMYFFGRGKRNWRLKVVYSILLLMLVYYGQPLTSITLLIFVWLLFCIFTEKNNGKFLFQEERFD